MILKILVIRMTIRSVFCVNKQKKRKIINGSYEESGVKKDVKSSIN